MVQNINGPGSPAPTGPVDPKKNDQSSIIDKIPESIVKQYPVQKRFKEMLQMWFKGTNISDKMVSMFEKNMTDMVKQNLKRAETQHKKIQQIIKERIKEG